MFITPSIRPSVRPSVRTYLHAYLHTYIDTYELNRTHSYILYSLLHIYSYNWLIHTHSYILTHADTCSLAILHTYSLIHPHSYILIFYITSHYITLYTLHTYNVPCRYVYTKCISFMPWIYVFSIDIFHTSSSKVTYPMFSMKQFCSWGWTGLWTLLQADVVPRDVFIKVGGLWSFVVFLLMGCHLHFFFAELWHSIHIKS